MGLYAIRNDKGRNETHTVKTGETFAKGDLLILNNGFLEAVAADAEVGDFVALEAVTSSAAGTKIVAISTRGEVEFEVDTEADTAADQIGDIVQFDTKSLLANAVAASANGFKILSIVGEAADRKVRGVFV